ncbi:NAD(P)H-dependent oxidoreductase [Nonlabens agnitus]|uniref:NAD(P)H-dependent oxidoreductase n=1 Tax=Nonlabens agnitus TaxID=870484 RepID=A0A2S9WR22_9FLAO|nr:NAD(P)H-dependent oxidoreductase [Nonlabens agnitus]PRP65908.1 NAD(P)H-dependent oxidoreductase [Nonlabens agnitus]
MTFLKSMQTRYTTKKYDASKKVDSTKIQDLKEILRLSPSSINSQPWKFTFVSDPEIKEQLSKHSWHNTNKVLDCDTVVVFSRINNLEVFEQHVNENLPQSSVNYYNDYIKPQTVDEIKAWFDKQVYLASGVFLSACAAMDIDATPMEGVEPEKYDEILKQKDHTTLMAVAIGYRDPEDANQPSQKPKSRKDLSDVVESI